MGGYHRSCDSLAAGTMRDIGSPKSAENFPVPPRAVRRSLAEVQPPRSLRTAQYADFPCNLFSVACAELKFDESARLNVPFPAFTWQFTALKIQILGPVAWPDETITVWVEQ